MTAPALGRTTFRTSRLLDFCSRKELIAQTGHREDQWPLVTLKELVDNALGARKDAAVAPVVSVIVDLNTGPKLPTATQGSRSRRSMASSTSRCASPTARCA
jgi:hypothetical protein